MTPEEVIARTLDHEYQPGTEFVNDPDDPGGFTAFGIAERYHPEARSITTREQAAAWYRERIWDRLHIGRLPEWLQPIAYDMAVNPGERSGIILVQKALGVTTDGAIGPQTVRAAERATPAAVLPEIVVHRILYYIARILERPSKMKFAKGWLRRSLSYLT
jgi:lysozyme family protein